MERRRDQRISAESENDAGGVSRAQAAETGPCGVESQVGERQEPCHPVADEHREHGPDHGDDDPGLARVVIIPPKSRFERFGREKAFRKPHREPGAEPQNGKPRYLHRSLRAGSAPTTPNPGTATKPKNALPPRAPPTRHP